MVPRLRTAPSGSAIATAIVSAWTSNPEKSYLFLHDRFLSACGSELWLLLGSQLNPRPAHWAGHSILTKPAFDAFALLHELGSERISASSEDALVTRRKDGTIAIAAWNLVEPNAAGAQKTITFDLNGVSRHAHATVRRVDASHGDTLDAWKKMGSPKYPTQKQIADLQAASEIGPPEVRPIRNHQFTLTVPAMGLAIVELH